MPGLPRFAVTDLHRNLSLLAVAFVGVHVLTAVLDTYVSIPALAIVIPFTSGYERFWLPRCHRLRPGPGDDRD